MKIKIHTHELVALDNCIYALGGYLGGAYISVVKKFDVKTQKWTDVPRMIQHRGYFGAVSMTV